MAEYGGEIEDWGDGTAIRSYTYVDDMTDGIFRLTHSDLDVPTNIGCPQYVSVDELVETVSKIANKKVKIKHVDGPVGVHARNFSNDKIYSVGWQSKFNLEEGIKRTYPWIEEQVKRFKK